MTLHIQKSHIPELRTTWTYRSPSSLSPSHRDGHPRLQNDRFILCSRSQLLLQSCASPLTCEMHDIRLIHILSTTNSPLCPQERSMSARRRSSTAALCLFSASTLSSFDASYDTVTWLNLIDDKFSNCATWLRERSYGFSGAFWNCLNSNSCCEKQCDWCLRSDES